MKVLFFELKKLGKATATASLPALDLSEGMTYGLTYK